MLSGYFLSLLLLYSTNAHGKYESLPATLAYFRAVCIYDYKWLRGGISVVYPAVQYRYTQKYSKCYILTYIHDMHYMITLASRKRNLHTFR